MANNKYSKQRNPNAGKKVGAKHGKMGAVKGSNRKGKKTDGSATNK